ncbi:uncharacterized protein LOC5569546 isoform X1 [Aedes aegypti]|uniref:Uncharacterized protein n=2 Tax=Aedes aegypti TaxID=7159 RepID=A0A6I8U464_AEDAE|nr:uncharacterized protein LOC5569546 isoform X1 [Aedes aegypti]
MDNRTLLNPVHAHPNLEVPSNRSQHASIVSKINDSQPHHTVMRTPEIITVRIMDTNADDPDNNKMECAAAEPTDVIYNSIQTSELANITEPQIAVAENLSKIQVAVQDPEQTEMINEDIDVQVAGSSAENKSVDANEKRYHPDGVQVQKSRKKHASTEMKFRCFNVNWSKISDHVLVRLRAMQDFKNANHGSVMPVSLRITKKEITTLTTGVVDQLRMIDSEIGANIMEDVSRQILQKYPCLDHTDDDGFGAGQGYVELKYKMINRNNYLNRFKTAVTVPENAIPLKKCRNVRAGTLKEYWTKSSCETNKVILSNLAKDEPALITDVFLQESQAYIRFRLDEKINTASMISQLPILRRRGLLNFHFEKATGVDVSVFRKYFLSKKEKIISYSLSCKPNLHLKKTSSDLEVLKFLCALVGENFNDLVREKEIGTRLDCITVGCPGPMLVTVDTGNGNTMFYVYANETRLSEGACDISTAVEDLFSIHFVHNFMYPKPVSKFMELLQEYFFKIITLIGSKSTATRVGQRQRVVRKIITALSNYEMSEQTDQ